MKSLQKLLLLFISASPMLSAMDVGQLLRSVYPEVEKELKKEDATAATQELGKLAGEFVIQREPGPERTAFINKVEALLARGADPNMIHRLDPILALATPNYPEIVELLLNAGADANFTSNAWKPLISAVYYNNLRIAQALLEHYADPNEIFEDERSDLGLNNESVLEIAAKRGNNAMVRLLLKYGADPNSRTVLGTILSNAVINGNEEIIRMLLQAGSDPSKTTRKFIIDSAYVTALEMFNNAQTEDQKEKYLRIIRTLDLNGKIRRTGYEKLP